MNVMALRPPRGPGFRRLLWLGVWGPISLLVGFGPLLLLNAAQLASLVVLPFSLPRFRRINSRLAWAIWGYWLLGLKHLIGLEIAMTGTVPTPGESALIIGNHQGMCDIVAALWVAQQAQTHDVKFMAKDVLKHIPLFGWAMRFVDFVFLKRNWADDEARTLATFERYRERKEPFWLVMFPEGTRRTPAKQAASEAYAAKSGFPVTKNVMLPRPKGFAASIHGLSGKLTAVYELTFDYGGTVPNLAGLIRGEHDRILVRIKRHDVAQIPRDQDGAARWLRHVFVDMDAWLEGRKLSPRSGS
jgi:1-acyl-sn-glycerol-3-phosphate acyltransferase